jgi:hypothetical protein
MSGGALAVVAVAAALALAGCGGDSGSQPQTTTSSAKPGSRPDGAGERHYVGKANAICRNTVRETRRLGRRFSSAANPNPSDALELAIKGFVKPGIPILEREARQLQRLKPVAANPDFDRYVDLFDPIDALAHELVHAGATGNDDAARRIQRLMTDLGDDQRALARQLGLRACDVDFVQVLTATALG